MSDSIEPDLTFEDEEPRVLLQPAVDTLPEVASSAPPAPVVAERELPLVSLEVYLVSSKRKPHQTAGFRYYATSRKLTAATMVEWARLWDEFNKREVR